MTNPNRDSYDRNVQREVYRDAEGNTHVTSRTSSVNTRRLNSDESAYRDGYVTGQVRERRFQENEQAVRDNDNAARGLLLGIILTSLLGLTMGALYYLSQRREAPVPVAPILVPSASPSPAAQSPSPAPRDRTTIIERTRELIPVPQPSPAAESPAPAPQTTIVVPSSQPSPQNQAPFTTQPQNQVPSVDNSGTSGTRTTSPNNTGNNSGTNSNSTTNQTAPNSAP